MRLAYWEVLIALRSGGIRIALLVFSILLFVALALGVIRTQQRQNDSRLIEEENALVEGLFEEALQGGSEPESPTNQNADQAERLSRLKKQLRMSARSPYLMSHRPTCGMQHFSLLLCRRYRLEPANRGRIAIEFRGFLSQKPFSEVTKFVRSLVFTAPLMSRLLSWPLLR